MRKKHTVVPDEQEFPIPDNKRLHEFFSEPRRSGFSVQRWCTFFNEHLQVWCLRNMDERSEVVLPGKDTELERYVKELGERMRDAT